MSLNVQIGKSPNRSSHMQQSELKTRKESLQERVSTETNTDHQCWPLWIYQIKEGWSQDYGTNVTNPPIIDSSCWDSYQLGLFRVGTLSFWDSFLLGFFPVGTLSCWGLFPVIRVYWYWSLQSKIMIITHLWTLSVHFTRESTPLGSLLCRAPLGRLPPCLLLGLCATSRRPIKGSKLQAAASAK